MDQLISTGAIAPPLKSEKIEPIPISYLDPNPFQIRAIDVANLGGLIRSIERYGFIGHLEARYNPYNPSGRKQLVYGHRRLRAAELAGLTKVPVKTVDYSDAQMRELAYIENGTVEPLSYWDEAQHFKALQDAGLSMQKIAETIGKSKGYVQGRLDVLRLPDGPLRDAAKTGQVEMTICNILLTMDEADRDHLFEEVKAGRLTASDLRAIRSAANRSAAADDHVIEIAYAPVEMTPFERPRALESLEGIELDLDPDLEGPDPAKLLEGTKLRRVYFDSTTFRGKTGRDWAERVMIQMRAVVPILRENCARADFTTLSDQEAVELRGLRDEATELLSVPELAVV